MKRSYPLTDYECQVVRETPELGWDDATWAEAQARDRLPIDLPAVENDESIPAQVIGVYDIEFGIAVTLLVTAALWVLL